MFPALLLPKQRRRRLLCALLGFCGAPSSSCSYIAESKLFFLRETLIILIILLAMSQLKNCFYLHIPKTGGTTFVKNFNFTVNEFSQLKNPDAIALSDGELIHMHLPVPSLEVFCEYHGIDFYSVLKNSTFVLTLRQPCEWLQSQWDWILKNELEFPHLLLDDYNYVFDRDGGGTINGLSLDDYISNFKDMSEAAYLARVKLLDCSIRYSSKSEFF